MVQFNTLTEEVTYLLETYEQARDKDDILYYLYLLKKGMPPVSILEFYKNTEHYYEKYNLASLESVGRIRRKVQEERLDLRPSIESQTRKKELQMSFYDWSKNAE